MSSRRVASFAGVCAVSALLLAACGGSSTPAASHGSTTTPAALATVDAFPFVAGSTTISLEGAHNYQPVPPPGGGTDDYHCTLVNPHITKNSFIVASHFFPNSPEVHHAILFLVPPSLVPEALAADHNGQGWTCFGETALPGQGIGQLQNTPWLAAWAPGHGLDQAPVGTGMPFPTGSLVVMQVHYNLLAGHQPVRVKLMLQTVPATRNLRPLHLDLLPAPPDIPCPASVHGPLCNRAASLADVGKRFGRGLVRFVNLLETICGRNSVDPPGGDTTSCTWPIQYTGEIVRLTAHMHLLGQSFKVVLDPGTPHAQTLLSVPNYNFDYQRSYDIKPVHVAPSDSLQVTCGYNPKLRQLLPQLRRLPPRYVTWGDGSSDEMCLAIVDWVAS
jgi:hypothetical protein